VPVIDGTGRCPLIAAATLAELTAPDVVAIGGSLFEEDPGDQVMQWLRQVHPHHCLEDQRVCTGSICLAAGMLDGPEASTHWAGAEQLERRRARYAGQRVVERGKVITAAGVPAGIDMALTLPARIHGPQLAQMVQRAIGYDPRPPVGAGSPSKAPAQMAGLRAIIAHHAAVPAPPGGHSGGHADAAGKRPRKRE
jgi:transcriptional regulator GlxA family with amidase domain